MKLEIDESKPPHLYDHQLIYSAANEYITCNRHFELLNVGGAVNITLLKRKSSCGEPCTRGE